MSQTINIAGNVTDAAGATGSFSVSVTLDSFTLTAVVNPSNAPAGTTRNLTVTPTGGTAPFTYVTPTSTAGLVFTAISSLPGQWTFVY